MSGSRVAAAVMPRAVDLLAQHPELVGVHPVADALDAAARWSA